jgi:NAD(P)-dependent dehydrogenase (short-subunit alcohol dehydrogenase family)
VFDASDKKSIVAWAADFRQRTPKLDVLVNNAAVISKQRATTAAGLELQFATNVLAYYLLMTELYPSLKAAAPGARIVNVASNYVATALLLVVAASSLTPRVPCDCRPVA